MEDEDAGRRPGMLTSWKEIASFFHRDVRTVQRWEREEGLPVHRHPHRRRSSVYAYPVDLEAWWARHGADAESDADVPSAERHPLARFGVRFRWAMAIIIVTAVAFGAALFLPAGSADPEFPILDLASVKTSIGLAVNHLEDLNGDGRGDAIVQGGGAEVYIYLGGASGAVRARPDAQIEVEGMTQVGAGPIGDVDGDGLTDVLVTAFHAEPATYFSTASSYLLRGRRDWPASLRLPRDADTEFYIDYRGDIRMGACFTPGVDLNGDGLSDLVIGGADYSPPGRPSAGGVFVLLGRAMWPKRVEVVSAADIAIHGSRAGEALRQWCAAADFTGDGITDLALLASEDTLWGLQNGRGRVYVLAGARDWPRVIEADRDASFRLYGSSPGAVNPTHVLGDVNGDSVADLVVGFSDATRRGSGGHVAVVFGGHTRHGTIHAKDADVVIRGGDSFGQSVAVTDLNLDGYADLLISEPATGEVRMILGGPQFRPLRGKLARFEPVLVGLGGKDTGAYGLAAGDYDGDGAPDIVLDFGNSGPQKRRLVRLMPALPIGVDIRPAAEPNVLVAGGVVAIGVSDSRTVRDMDMATLRFGGAAPTRTVSQDFDADGKLDLRLFFEVDRLRIRPGTTRLALTGRTRSGIPVAGADEIVFVSRPAASSGHVGTGSVIQREQ